MEYSVQCVYIYKCIYILLMYYFYIGRLCTGMQSNINSCEGHVKLSKNDDDFYIVKMQVARGDPTSGSFEILLKGYLQGTATFSHSKNSREGNLKVCKFYTSHHKNINQAVLYCLLINLILCIHNSILKKKIYSYYWLIIKFD